MEIIYTVSKTSVLESTDDKMSLNFEICFLEFPLEIVRRLFHFLALGKRKKGSKVRKNILVYVKSFCPHKN